MYLNKNFKIAMTVFIGSTLTACASKKNDTAQVVSNFKMTSSSSTATVARNKNIFSLLMPQAFALTPSTIVDSTGAVVTLSDAWTVIKEIEFKSEESHNSEDNQSEVEFKGPYFVNLLSTNPDLLDSQMIAQKYIKRIKLKLEATQASLPVGAPAGLANNSIYYAGSISGKNFSFQLDDGTEINIAGPHSFQPSDNSQILVQIQTANIFKQIDLTSIVNNEVISHSNRHTGSSLCPSIDSSAADLYTCFRKGFEAHADLGVDKNGDNSLDNNDDHVK